MVCRWRQQLQTAQLQPQQVPRQAAAQLQPQPQPLSTQGAQPQQVRPVLLHACWVLHGCSSVCCPRIRRTLSRRVTLCCGTHMVAAGVEWAVKCARHSVQGLQSQQIGQLSSEALCVVLPSKCPEDSLQSAWPQQMDQLSSEVLCVCG